MKQALIPKTMIFLVAAASVVTTAAITWAVLVRPVEPASDPLPVLFKLPDFALTDQDERTFGSEQLKGKVWVADFMFTRCNGICPMLSANMQAVQTQLQNHDRWNDVRLVSISVDSDNDTPAVLREYAQRFQAEPGQWVFLTGQRETVWPLIENGFKLMVGEDPDNEAMPYSHSGKFALIDQQGRVRAYHDGTTPQGRDALIADLHRLLER